MAESIAKDWIKVIRPGYLGSRREKMEARWDECYGPGNWRIVWGDAMGK